MKKLIIFIALVYAGLSKAQTNAECEQLNYISVNYEKALAAEVYGIPPSVKLAQGILESRSGNSLLSVSYNSHFGIKCFKKDCPPSHCINMRDDTPKDKFVIYLNAEESYQAHTDLLLTCRYEDCQFMKWQDYCDCISNKGYASNKHYAVILKRLIIKYKLYEYTAF